MSVRIGSELFKREKILRVLARKSILYIRNPYVMEVDYAKIHKTTSYINIGHSPAFSVPIESLESTMRFRYKFRERSHILDAFDLFKGCPNAELSCELADDRGISRD